MRSLQFHGKFSFDRDRLATLIRCLAEEQEIVASAAAKYMGVGVPAAIGSLGWLVKIGLGVSSQGKYILTPLGTLIFQHDAELNNLGTLWLLHYYLTTDHNERAEVWYRAFNEIIIPGVPFTHLQIQIHMEQSLGATKANRNYVEEDRKRFLGSYINPKALGRLNLIREVAKNTYEAELINPPEPYIFAFALFDTWQRRFSHADTLRITQICEEPQLPGKVFVARRDQIVQQLQILQSLGLVNIVESQHEPVTRRFHEAPLQLLESYYSAL